MTGDLSLTLRAHLREWRLVVAWMLRDRLGCWLIALGERIRGPQPPPIVRIPPPCVPVVETMVTAPPKFELVPAPPPVDPALAQSQWCDVLAERSLSNQIADFYGLDRGEVWTALGNLPSNCAHLIDSPQGWSVVADWIATEFGAPREGILTPAIN